MSNILYREITPYSESIDRWNNVTINAGAAQSTLQDIKLPEGAGSFAYFNSGDLSSNCSNRFIYWRTNHDIIELVEISLDSDLRANHLRLRFQNTPILPGVSIHEYDGEVILLVATVSAIHKLAFPHPKRLEKDAFRVKRKDSAVPSIFHDTTEEVLRSRSCYYVLNHVSLGNPLPHTSCSWLDADGNATFVLANSAGSLLMMSDKQGVQVTKELVKTGSIFRILNGLVPSVMKSSRPEVALNIICHQYMSDTLLYSLFNDLQVRIWSYKKQEYIFADSVINFDAQKNLSAGNYTAHQCQLRKSESTDDSSLFLGIFVPVMYKKIFYIFRQSFYHERLKLELVSTLHQVQHDLVDFCIGASRLWTLWLSSENQPIVLSAIIDPWAKTEPDMCWMPMDLEPRVSRTIDFGDSNPQEMYIKEIFKVGRFLPSTISKAISIYNSMKNTSFSASMSLKVDDLKNRVIEAVENEILIKTGDMDNTRMEYLEIVADCWDRFFSYCIQYHEVGMKPLGMTVDPNTGCVIVVKKNFYSLLCPCDPLQYLVSPDFRSASVYINPDDSDKKLYQGLKAVLACIDLIHETIDDRLLMRFGDKIYNLYSPIKYASEICKTLDLEMDSHFLKHMQSVLPSNQDIVSSLDYLVNKLDLGPDARSVTDATFSKYPSFGNSSSGIGALCSGLSHFAKQRFEFCRDLLLFEVIIWGLDAMENDQLDNLMLQSSIIPRTVSLVKSYYVILWCTQCDCVPVNATIQDSAFKQFTVLESPEFMNTDLTTIKQDCTISHLFFQKDGGSKVRQMIHINQTEISDGDNWTSLFPSFIVASAALLWPLEGNMFPEFLFSQCQFLPLQEYDRLLQGWCSWNKQYLNFLVATSFLILGEQYKALKLFLNVSKEIESQSYLCNRFLKGRYNSSLISLFCMKVIQMFEQFSLSDCVVKLVSTTIEEIEESDPHIPIFYSVLFKHHLNLGHSEEAFSTLIKNPDSSRRKDCLRQLIVYLCEKKQFQKIIDLSYLAYEEEVIGILESRARCSDLSRNTSFYGILYALHIHHKKFRKAASVMYELAMRFGKEVITLKGLSKQVSCYLTAINCLHLAKPEYAWIVKPVISFDENVDDSEEMDCRNSPKRDADGEEILNSARPVKIEVLGLKDIQCEYNLVQARLEHAQKSHNSDDSVITKMSPEETVALLLNASLYDSAIRLSKSFSLSLVPVFEALANRCVTSMLNSDTYSSHETEKDIYMKIDGQEDYINSNISCQQNMWNTLKKYLFQYELPGQSELHKCITEKLLSRGASLPAWLRLSYQKRNFTEMINLYISHGLLEDALYLMIKYIKAVLGDQKEDFDLKHSLQYNLPSVWLPHTYIDILLDAATDLQHDVRFKVLYQELNEILDKYNKIVESVTASKLT